MWDVSGVGASGHSAVFAAEKQLGKAALEHLITVFGRALMHALTPSPAPQQMQTMLNSPEFLQQMSSVMSNPAVLDQIIASNPQLSAMGPQVREGE